MINQNIEDETTRRARINALKAEIKRWNASTSSEQLYEYNMLFVKQFCTMEELSDWLNRPSPKTLEHLWKMAKACQKPNFEGNVIAPLEEFEKAVGNYPYHILECAFIGYMETLSSFPTPQFIWTRCQRLLAK